MKRTFIALDVNPKKETLDEIESIRQLLAGENIKWVDTQRLHLTLRFLGDTDDSIVPSIAEKLMESLKKVPSFTVKLNSLGVFKNIHNPRVIWLGCNAGTELLEIYRRAGNVLTEHNFKEEETDFKPHFTLGRIKELKNKVILEQLIAEYKGFEFQKTEISEVIFYESLLKPQGPEYILLKKMQLKLI